MRSALGVFAVGIAIGAMVYEGEPRVEGPPARALKLSLLTYTPMGVAVLMLWPTPDVWSTVGKYVVLGLFALDIGRDVLALKWHRGPVVTSLSAWSSALGAIMMLVCVVFLWP